ncbi:MAG: YcxB family protein [Candidatus Parcubacteria bacterium]|nr:YcxB family protein [Candidatus Parcubacteria bacterium]
MLQFIIKIRLEDYRKLLFIQVFRKPAMIFIMVIAILNLIFAVPYFLGNYSDFPIFNIMFGLLVVVLIPYSVLRQSKNTFKINKFLQEQIRYEFTEDQVSVSGETFNSNYKWDNIFKIEELKDWLIIYHDKIVANILFKPQMDSKDLKELKEMILRKNIKSKLLK